MSASLNLNTQELSSQRSYTSQLRRYPYLTDVVGSYATLNWATDRSETSGGIRYGKMGSESCTAHYAPATKTNISINSVLSYQWKAQLNLVPGTQYCYRVYLGTGPVNEIDLLGSDASPSFWTQVPNGSADPFSFVVFGDWGQVNSSGVNPSQANLMSLIAASGARFAVTTGDNGYPSGSQKNFGDLIQTGPDISAIFGPSFWKVPGASLPLFPTLGNHGFASSDSNHPMLITFPQDRAVAASGGRYIKETYCCLNGSTSAAYPSAWYAIDAGPARFYMLHAAWSESNVGTASEYQMDYDYHWAPGTPQYEWLQADLAAHPSVLKFAFFHYPLYSDNPHEAADTFLLGSNSLEGLLKQNGVDLAFTGHAHIYERNLASADGIPNYLTGGGGATLGTLGTCTSLDAYAIKFTTSGKACGSAPVPTSADQVYHFLKVTVDGTSVTVTPINALGQPFDVQNYTFTAGAEANAPSTPTGLTASTVSGTQVNLSWSASTDDTGVRGYGIYRNGNLVATVDADTLSYSDTGLIPSTSYSYRVDAFDGSGNHSARSSSQSATTASTATYIFPAVADAYVAGDATTTNYGTAVTLKVDDFPDYRSYLRFYVGDLDGTVTSATLRIYTTSSSSTGYQVRQVTDQNWEEGTITYANAPAVGSPIGSSGSTTANTWTSVDVTSWITGNGIYDLALTTATTGSLNFRSREAASNLPELVIETSATAGPTSTPGATSTATMTPSPTATASQTPTITPTATTGSSSTLTFTTVADARVSESSPTTNYGTATTLQADAGSGAAVTSFLRFNTSGITGSIQNVKLRVFCTTNGTINGPAAYLADSTWTESGAGGVTWSTQPALLSGAFDNKGAISTNTWVEYDVTSLVAGDGAYTFALVGDSTDGVTFSSREGASDPELVVTFDTSTPTATRTPTTMSTATDTATSTPTATGTATATNTTTLTPTSSPAVTDTATPSLTSTNSPTATLTPTNTAVATDTPTDTPTPTSSPFITDTATATPTVSSMPTATDTLTPTNSPAATDTVTPSQTPTATETLTNTSTPTDVATFTPTATSAPTETEIPTDTASPTNSPVATDTVTSTPTATGMPTDTATPTSSPTVTSVPTVTDTPTNTLTPTPTNSPVATDTATSTPTATEMPTDTAAPTSSPTTTSAPTMTNTPTDTLTPTATNSPVVTNTMTATATPSQTPTTTSTPTATSGSGTVLTFITVADARVAQASPTSNYGNATNIQADGGSTAAQTSYIRFTVSGINDTIQNVKLRVFCTTNGTNNGPAVYLADNNWIEKGTGGVTWSTQPVLLSGAFDNKGAISTNTWVEYDVTSLVTGDGTYTFALVGDSTDGVTFSSREGASDPELVVTLGTGAAAATNAPFAIDVPTVPAAPSLMDITPTPVETPVWIFTVTPTDTP